MKLPDLRNSASLHIDIAGVLLCAGVSALAYFAVLRPLARHRAILAEQRQEFAARRGELSDISASAGPLAKQLQEVRQALAESKVSLKPADRVNERIAELNELVSRCGLKVDDIELGEVVAGPRYETVPISLAGCGGYVDCATFIHQLCGAFPDTGVASFEIWGEPQRAEVAGRFRLGLLWYAAPRLGRLAK